MKINSFCIVFDWSFRKKMSFTFKTKIFYWIIFNRQTGPSSHNANLPRCWHGLVILNHVMPICSLLKWQRFLLKVISHKYGVFLFFFTVSDNECEGCVGEPLCTYGLTDLWTEKQTNKEMLREDQDVSLKRLHASLCQRKSFARADGKEKSHASPVVELCKYRSQQMFEAT